MVYPFHVCILKLLSTLNHILGWKELAFYAETMQYFSLPLGLLLCFTSTLCAFIIIFISVIAVVVNVLK